jgi:predicted amidohydrolase YtcJ
VTSPATGRTVLLRGGSVYSPADPFATAMLTEGDVVAWVGGEEAADGYADTADEVVRLDGALVTPAFVDAHVHITGTGLTLTGLNLSECRSLAELLDRVERYSRARRGSLILGQGWDDTRWPERRPPRREELDRASYGGVVQLTRVDGHSSVVSSALVAAAPELREADGWSTEGLLVRRANHLARRVVRGSLSPGDRRELQRAALRRAAAMGIGCVHECAGPDVSGEADFASLLELAAAEPLPDVVGYWGELRAVDKARKLGAHAVGGDLFVDGSLGSRTACLSQEYADAPTCGACYLDAHDVAAHLIACTEAGVQAGFHAIGDVAVRTVLDGCAAAAAEVGVDRLRAGRHRVEHAEMADAEGVARFAAYGLVASVQPAFDALWGGSQGMYAQRLGADRALTLNPFGSLAAAGVPLAFGSDSPVTPFDPWGTIRAAAYHHVPEQRLTVRAGFTAHTRGGWRAARRDDGGRLLPGAAATYAVWRTGELVVQTPDERIAAWSTDPRSGVPGLPDLSPDVELPACLRTVIRGQVVHEAEGALR